MVGPGRKYLISLLFDKGVLSGLLLKFELLWLFSFVSVFGPGIEHSILLLLTTGLRTSSSLLFKFELLPLFVKQLVLLFVLAHLLSEPVFAQHCSLPALRMLSFLMLQFVPVSSLSVPTLMQFIFNILTIQCLTCLVMLLHFWELLRNAFFHLPLFSISTLHLPNCVIVVQLYVLSLVASFVAGS